MTHIPKKLVIGDSKIMNAGRGVVCVKKIIQDEVIEVAPVYVLPRKDYPMVKKTSLRDYYFMWGKSTAAICLGYGSLYNHSYEPNATYMKNIQDRTISFIALRDIMPGEEITTNYNYGKPSDDSKLWIADIPES